jgi:hypothetical protein
MNKTHRVLISSAASLAALAWSTGVASAGPAKPDPVHDVPSWMATCETLHQHLTSSPQVNVGVIADVALAISIQYDLAPTKALSVELQQVQTYCGQYLPAIDAAGKYAQSQQPKTTQTGSRGGGGGHGHGGNHGHGSHGHRT